jgi:tetratricopeptide (TPR) repeat protein
MLLSMEARSLASLGDAKGCAHVLHQAEVLFDGANSGADPAWISYFNVQELAGEAAHCFRDLGQHEQAREFAIRAIDPVHTPQRTKAFIDVVLASAVLGAGELEEAIRLGTTALEVAGALQSHRSLTYFTDFRRTLLDRHPQHPLVLDFADRATAALAS